LDYWVSYSYLDTKRKFLDYPKEVQPNFAATHTASIVIKTFLTKISTNIGLTYIYASGRPYFNPNKSATDFMSDRTIDYNSFGLSANYLTRLWKANSVVMLNISNLFGTYQVNGYNFSATKNSQGLYTNAPIIPSSKRFIFLGLYMSFGVDRRGQIIDNN
jgi:vitamin B12 transporter